MRTIARVQRGFTLIEVMIVVVIVAILAAVVIPSFMRESSKTKANTEVNAMFAEIAVKEEQYKIENNVYLLAPKCPSAPSAAGAVFTTACVGAWLNLRVAPPETKVRCAYNINAGLASVPPVPPTGFTMLAPATSWWFVVAECDMDGKGGTNATFFMSSVDTQIQKQNEGK